jgi:hypothetical protein
MIVTVETAQSPYEDDAREEMDVCDWLNVNPDVKAVLDGVLAEYLKAWREYDFFPSDVIHAAMEVAMEVGRLCTFADDVFHHDSVIDRVDMHVKANQVAAAAIKFLMVIGNLKARYK